MLLPHLPSLERDNAQLRMELVERQLELAKLQEALRHTAQRQALLQLAPSGQGIVAQIIGRSTIPTQQTVLLDRGQESGLVVDSLVINTAGIIGRVTELYQGSAMVLLLTDPESRVAAMVDRSRETGLLVGRGLGQCELIYLDGHADLQEGDRVVTAGLNGSFPKGLLLGTIVRIVRDEQLGTASAWVSPAVHLSQLEEVRCVPATR